MSVMARERTAVTRTLFIYTSPYLSTKRDGGDKSELIKNGLVRKFQFKNKSQ